eukprot:gene20513-26608_t
MYSGGSKADGGIVGLISKSNDQVDLNEIADITSAEESLIGINENGEEIQLVAQLTINGDVHWVKAINNDENDISNDLFNVVIKRTISMSQMTSMLRDKDRNNIYEKAISLIIDYYHKTYNRYPIILDIGTGTGLLAMLCARYGSEKVIGCEMFSSMAEIAYRIIDENNLSDIITIIAAKSTDIESIPEEISSNGLVDIIVSELLDSSLLGESCVSSCSDAITRLLSYQDSDNIQNQLIPHSATVYGVAIESSIVNDMVDVSKISDIQWTVYRDNYASQCEGGWPPIPIHWNQLKVHNPDSKELSLPIPILNVEFFETNTSSNTQIVDITITSSGSVSGILTYWDLYLLSPTIDPNRECVYSTSPNSTLNWQDHWLQLIYPLPHPLQCDKDDTIRLFIIYDTIRISIDAELIPSDVSSEFKSKKLKSETGSDVYEPSICSCGWHMLYSAERLQILNDEINYKQPWNKVIDYLVNQMKSSILLSDKIPIILDASDGSNMSLTLAKVNQSITNNNLVNVIVWDGFELNELIEDITNDHILDNSTLIIPSHAYVMIAPIELPDLKSGHGPVVR